MNIKIVGSLLAGMAAGVVGGYFLAKYQLEDIYSELAEKEIEEARVYYKKLTKKDGFETVEKAAETLAAEKAQEAEDLSAVGTIVMGQRYVSKPKPQKVVSGKRSKKPVQTANVFDDQPEDNPDADYSDEIAARGYDSPYVISVDEYMQNETNFAQTTYTYFIMDGILTDEAENRIDDTEQVVGQDNLQKFGHRSGDKNVVYVRNERYEMEYEICLHGGSYAEIVGGLPPTGSHSRR
jgi:hypothetical protein